MNWKKLLLMWRWKHWQTINRHKDEMLALKRGHSTEVQRLKEKREKEVFEAHRVSGQIVEALCRFNWRRPERSHDHFCVQLMFDSYMIGHVQDSPKQLDHVIYHLQQMLEYEMKKYRFVMPPEIQREERKRHSLYGKPDEPVRNW